MDQWGTFITGSYEERWCSFMDNLELQEKKLKRSLQADRMRMVEQLYMVVLDLLETYMRHLAPSGQAPEWYGEPAARARGVRRLPRGPPDEDFWLDVLAYAWPRLTEGLMLSQTSTLTYWRKISRVVGIHRELADRPPRMENARGSAA